MGDRLLAKCEAEINIEIYDTVTEQRVPCDSSSVRVQVCCLAGPRQQDLHHCLLLAFSLLAMAHKLSECEAEISIKIYDTVTEQRVPCDSSSVRVQLCCLCYAADSQSLRSLG